MELDYALLADSAQVANGKTFILGGGVSIITTSQLPTPLNVVLVMQLTYEKPEVESKHALRVLVIDADGNPVVPEIQGEFQLGQPDPSVPRNVPLVAPILIGFPPIPALQREGAYDVQILVDGRHLKTLPFAVLRQAPGEAHP
jgi:hypothetical protein